MIASLEGRVTEKEENRVILEIAGVGYEVNVSAPTYLGIRSGETLRLHVVDVVREDSHDLYGFVDASARALFRRLVGVSGVGPKTAMQVMSNGPVSEIARAIEEGEVTKLTGVPGVGSKTAQKIILELRGKLADSGAGADMDVIDALVGLGYQRNDASKAVAALAGAIAGDEARLKAALRNLSKR